MAKPKYDVALSFLSADRPTASALRDRLSEGLEVFFFPRNQEDLAGTNGLESMRTPFLEDSRIVVVLYREPWGKTPWTGVEQTAIKDNCLKHGWHRLFFIVLENAGTLPIWLPHTHVGFNYPEYGLEQAVGAIKARVQESGGVLAPLTASRRAELVAQDASYIEDRKKLNSEAGLKEVTRTVLELLAELIRLCAVINEERHLSIQAGKDTDRCVLTNDKVSLIVSWRQHFTNSMDGCGLTVREFSGRIKLPSESQRLMYVYEPTMLREMHFLPELSRTREYGWIDQVKPSEVLSSVALANKCVIQFLDLVERDNRGKVGHPDSL